MRTWNRYYWPCSAVEIEDLSPHHLCRCPSRILQAKQASVIHHCSPLRRNTLSSIAEKSIPVSRDTSVSIVRCLSKIQSTMVREWVESNLLWRLPSIWCSALMQSCRILVRLAEVVARPLGQSTVILMEDDVKSSFDFFTMAVGGGNRAKRCCLVSAVLTDIVV